MEIDLSPLKSIENLDNADRVTITKLAMVMSMVHETRINALDWRVNKLQGDYEISVDFPHGTPFNYANILLVKQTNDAMIKDVWVVNKDATKISLCCKLASLSSGQSYRIKSFEVRATYEEDRKRPRLSETTAASMRFVKKPRLERGVV